MRAHDTLIHTGTIGLSGFSVILAAWVGLAALPAQAQVPCPLQPQRLFWIDTGGLQDQVTQALEAVPSRLRTELYNTGVRVVLVPTFLAYQPQWSNQIPRGWRKELDYRYIDALYMPDRKEVVVAARSLDVRSGQPHLARRTLAVTLHELGHAFDRANKVLSSGPAFLAAYRSDCAPLKADQQKRYHYMLQGNQAGQKELFAELFMMHFRTRAHATPQFPQLATDFPRCYAELDRVLAAYEEP